MSEENDMHWEHARTDALAGIQRLDDGTWQSYLEYDGDRGTVQAEVNDIPDADVRRLYEQLKKHFEG